MFKSLLKARHAMKNVRSQDGTAIAFDQSGEGPAIILVLGACNDHFTGSALAERLSEHFTVFNGDRRARGESSDTAPYAIEREIEDIAALIDEAGGSAQAPTSVVEHGERTSLENTYCYPKKKGRLACSPVALAGLRKSR
jgi:hypothetical protein